MFLIPVILWWISAGDSSMSLCHYVTSVHMKNESRLVGYIVCEDAGGGDL